MKIGQLPVGSRVRLLGTEITAKVLRQSPCSTLVRWKDGGVKHVEINTADGRHAEFDKETGGDTTWSTATLVGLIEED